jgi:hypothetical protein
MSKVRNSVDIPEALDLPSDQVAKLDPRGDYDSGSDKDATPGIAALYSPSEEASQLPPGAGGEGPDAIADEPSVFDDPVLRKFYWPRKDYEGIHRFFPDFKWTVGEEKRYPIICVC